METYSAKEIISDKIMYNIIHAHEQHADIYIYGCGYTIAVEVNMC